MKKGLISLIAGAAVLAGGAMAVKKYREYKTPEMINMEVLKDGTFIGTYRSRAPKMIRDLSGILEDYNTQTGTVKDPFGQSVAIYISPMEDRANYIVKNWGYFEENSKRSKTDSRWDASDNLVYNMLKGIGDSEREGFYSSEKRKLARDHELDHVDRNKESKPYTPEQKEASAYLESLTHSALAMEDVLHMYKHGGDPHRSAAEIILKEFLNYSDTPGLHALCNLPGIDEKIPKRAREIKKKLFGE